MNPIDQRMATDFLLDVCKLAPDDIRGDEQLEALVLDLYLAFEKAIVKVRGKTPKWAKMFWGLEG